MEGKQLGVISLADALTEATRRAWIWWRYPLPPCLRLPDHGLRMFLYQQSKKVQVSKKSQTVIQVKEIRHRPKQRRTTWT